MNNAALMSGLEIHRVTSGEYMRFLEAERPNLHIPDHWEQAECGRGSEPIVGIRGNDALAYCAWLERQLTQSGTKKRVRLPRAEDLTGPLKGERVGVWLKRGVMITLFMDTQAADESSRLLRELIARDWHSDVSRDFDLRLYRSIDANTERDRALEVIRDRSPHQPMRIRMMARPISVVDVLGLDPEDIISSCQRLHSVVKGDKILANKLPGLRRLARDLHRAITESQALSHIRGYALCTYLAWEWITIVYEEPTLLHAVRRKEAFEGRAIEALNLYLRVALIDYWTHGEMPTLGGLCVAYENFA